jgi:hypothetical protein
MTNRRSEEPLRAGSNTAGAHHIPLSSKLHFKIDRITCEGYSAADQRRFTFFLKSNLTRLAENAPGWSELSGLNIDRLKAESSVSAASPEQAARQIAALVLGRITQGKST